MDETSYNTPQIKTLWQKHFVKDVFRVYVCGSAEKFIG